MRNVDRTRRAYGRLAGSYDRSAKRWDRILALDEGRRWVGERARGHVLEVGIGTGLSLVHYDRSVDLVGVDVTPAMLDIAHKRTRALGRSAELHLADAAALPFAGSSFDTVVFAYSLCSIPSPQRALAEATRLLRDGGALLAIEHVRSPNLAVRLLQLLLNPFFLLVEADSLLRDPLPLVAGLGYKVEELERLSGGVIERLRATKLRAATAP